MTKGLEALKDIRLRLFIESEVQSKKVVKDLKTIEKELIALDIIKKYLLYNDSWYENQAQYGYEQIYLRMENSPFATDEEKEDLIKVKEWLKDET